MRTYESVWVSEHVETRRAVLLNVPRRRRDDHDIQLVRFERRFGFSSVRLETELEAERAPNEPRLSRVERPPPSVDEVAPRCVRRVSARLSRVSAVEKAARWFFDSSESN